MQRQIWWVVLAALVLAGCSTKFERIEPAEPIQPGQRIGVLPVNFLDKPSVVVHSNPIKYASTLALVAIKKGDITRQEKLTEAFEAQGYDYREQFNDALITGLEAAGFEADIIEFRRSIDNILEDVPPGRFEKRYPKGTGYDLLLDLYVDYVGYLAPTVTTDYQPTFHVAARVLDADRLKPLYQAQVLYHPIETQDGDLVLPPDGAFSFPDFDELIEDPAVAREGIEQAVDRTVRRLVHDIAGTAAP